MKTSQVLIECQSPIQDCRASHTKKKYDEENFLKDKVFYVWVWTQRGIEGRLYKLKQKIEYILQTVRTPGLQEKQIIRLVSEARLNRQKLEKEWTLLQYVFCTDGMAMYWPFQMIKKYNLTLCIHSLCLTKVGKERRKSADDLPSL